jgi:predicted permease
MYTIAGVLPRRFEGIKTGDSTDLYTTFPHSPDVLAPGSFYADGKSNPLKWYIQLIGRRDAGMSSEAFGRMLEPRFRSTWTTQPTNGPEGTPSLRVHDAGGGLGGLRREMGNPVKVLLSLVGLVLLMACANIANLLLARADARRKEVALRISLGCSRARLAAQLFTESVLLALLGGLASIPVGWAAANFAVRLMPGDLRLNFDPDFRMGLATLGVAVLASMVFGLYPAFRASNIDTIPALKEGSGSVGTAIRKGRLGWPAGKVLVFAQVALGVLLVSAAGAFNLHLRKILSNDSGFERTRLLLFELRPGQSGYQAERLRQFHLDLEARLRDVPGVQHAGLARIRPMRGGGYSDRIEFKDAENKKVDTSVNFVTESYLDALGVPIVAGRGLTGTDIRSRAAVAVVSEDFAKELGRSPLGLHFEMDSRKLEVVGIAKMARYSRLTTQPKVLYLPISLKDDTVTAILRTALPPGQVLAGVRKAVTDLDPNLPMVQTVTMEEQIASTLRRERLFAWLCGAFGVLALVLCAVGLYGVMSYSTTRRKQEVGIRMALGASPSNVLRMVVREGMSVAFAGILVGVPTTWWAASKFIDYKRLGMAPPEPSVWGIAIGVLLTAALVAILAPALRAAAVDPLRALRDE